MQTAFRIDLTPEQCAEIKTKVELNVDRMQRFYLLGQPSHVYGNMEVAIYSGIHAEIVKDCLTQATDRLHKTGPLGEPPNDKWTCIGRYVEDNEPFMQCITAPTAKEALILAEHLPGEPEIFGVIAGDHKDAIVEEAIKNNELPR